MIEGDIHMTSDHSILRGPLCGRREDAPTLSQDWSEVTCRTCLGDRQCEARTTVQLGPMAATDLRCLMPKRAHNNRHKTGRQFGHVDMTASWPGEWTVSDD